MKLITILHYKKSWYRLSEVNLCRITRDSNKWLGAAIASMNSFCW